MKYSIILIIASFLIYSCSSKVEDSVENRNEKSEIFLDNKIDSIIHFSHQPLDSLEDEIELFEEDSLLAQMLMEDVFNFDSWDSLRYYYNTEKVISDKNEILELNRYFKVVDAKELDQQNKCVVLYRDIFIFCSEGEYKAFVKVCFSCQQSFFQISSLDYFNYLGDRDLRLKVDVPGLKKYLNN